MTHYSLRMGYKTLVEENQQLSWYVNVEHVDLGQCSNSDVLLYFTYE